MRAVLGFSCHSIFIKLHFNFLHAFSTNEISFKLSFLKLWSNENTFKNLPSRFGEPMSGDLLESILSDLYSEVELDEVDDDDGADSEDNWKPRR